MSTPRLPRQAVTRAVTRAAVCQVAGVCATLLLLLGLAPSPAWADWIRTDQWQLAALKAPAAWRYSTGSGVVVAVLDSGVEATHPDLAGQVLAGADFVDGSTDGRRDFVGHGTTVAAFIAGRADDGDGVEGIAPDAKILPVRVLDADNRYDDPAVVAQGLRWAVDHGATVINLSLGGTQSSEVLASALSYAAGHDVVVIACTGNVSPESPGSEIWYPAREPGVIAVAGLDAQPVEATGDGRPTGSSSGGSGASGGELLWSGSLTGPQTLLTAPATGLVGARPGGYWRVQGTSFAAPMVAATAALVRARWPRLDAGGVTDQLIHTAHDLGPSGRDDRYGYGEVDPLAALATAPPVTAGNRPAGATASTGRVGPDPTGGGDPAGAHRLALARAAAVAVTQRLVFAGWAALLASTLLVWTGWARTRHRLRAQRRR